MKLISPLKKKYEVAKKRYKDFQDECNVKVGERIKEDWDYKIAKDFYENVYEKCPAPTAAAAAAELKYTNGIKNLTIIIFLPRL